jgi:hypothetical protein
MYALIEKGTIKQFPYSIAQLKKDHPGTSFADVIPDERLVKYNMYPVTRDKKPGYNNTTHRAVMDTEPRLKGGKWVQTWSVTPKSAEDVTKDLDKAKAAKKKQLAQAARKEFSTQMREYSEWEAVVWPLLIAEAEQYMADGTVGEYMAAEIGTKYETAGDLATVVIARKESMRDTRAAIVIERQKKEMAIDAATTISDVESVDLSTAWPE